MRYSDGLDDFDGLNFREQRRAGRALGIDDADNFPELRGGETAATARGREAHAAHDYGPGYEKDFRLPSGDVADAVHLQSRDIVELKPNKPKAISRGKRQVERYRRELEKETGQPFTGRVETYEP